MGQIERLIALEGRLTGWAVVHFASTSIYAFDLITTVITWLTFATVAIESKIRPGFFPLGLEFRDNAGGIGNAARTVRAARNSDDLFRQFQLLSRAAL